MAADLREKLEKRNVSVWIDTKNNISPTKRGMKEGVESSDVFCLILTKKLFHSYWVRLERWAVSTQTYRSSVPDERADKV